MSTVNYANPNKDLTVRVFDNFYNYDVNVPADEYDIVYSYFRSVMSTTRAAGNFAVSLFRVAQDTNVPALTLLDAMKGQTGITLTASLAYCRLTGHRHGRNEGAVQGRTPVRV